MVGDARQRGPAAGLGLAEVRRPLVVDLVDVVGQLLIFEEEADAQDAVHDLGVNAVDGHVLEAQLRGRGMGAALVEAGVEHGVHVQGAAALGAVEEEAEAAEHAELLLSARHLGPSSVSTTRGTACARCAGARSIQRSPGIQVMSMCESPEITR